MLATKMLAMTETVKCPFCGYEGPPRSFHRFVKPEDREEDFNTIYRCPNKECKLAFSPRRERGGRGAL